MAGFNPDAWLAEQMQEPPQAAGKPPAEPAANEPRRWAGILPGLAVGLLGVILVWWFLARPQNGHDPGPQPAGVVATVEAATRQLATNYSRAMDRLAEQVEGGDLTTAVQIQANAQAYTKAARINAFGPVDQLDTDNIPAEVTDENRDAVVAYLQQKAEGHRRAVQ